MSGASEVAEQSALTSREQFSIAIAPNPAPAAQHLDQQNSMSFAAPYRQPVVSPPPPYQTIPAVGSSPPQYQSISAGGIAINHVNSGDQKRKRGRPRKYGPDGGMAPSRQPQPIGVSISHNFSSPAAPLPVDTDSQVPMSGSASPTVKKPRGRPPGSSTTKKQGVEALAGSTGIGFIPHVLNVKAGEDVASKIMAFSQNGPRAVCVLSATGAIASVTLRQAATSGGTATYEGRYEILSLSGSFLPTEIDGQKTRSGGLSITLAGPDGRVLGGCLGGVLLAASPVQVIVGSFMADGRQENRPANNMDPSSAPSRGGNLGGSCSPSRGTQSGSSGGPASPFNLSSGMPWK